MSKFLYWGVSNEPLETLPFIITIQLLLVFLLKLCISWSKAAEMSLSIVQK